MLQHEYAIELSTLYNVRCAKCLDVENSVNLSRVITNQSKVLTVRLEFDCPSCDATTVVNFVHAGNPTVVQYFWVPGTASDRYATVHSRPEYPIGHGWRNKPAEGTPAVVAPEPVVARESEAERREKQQQIERTANALEAHRKIAELVLSKRRSKLAFANRSTVVGRLAKLREQWVWAVDASNPAIEEILNDHGGKLIIGKLWEDLKLIATTQKKHHRGGVAAQRTFSVTLGSRAQVWCYLFPAKSLEDARKGVLQIGSMF